MNVHNPNVTQRAALYLRVSTSQAEHDVSIPDQRKQGEAWCEARGYQLVETFVEPGASATNDRRPEFQRLIEAGTSKPAPFDIVVVHSFSRFFRDHFELEFYVRKLAKNGIRLVSITQEMGDDPMHVMMRQIMALRPAAGAARSPWASSTIWWSTISRNACSIPTVWRSCLAASSVAARIRPSAAANTSPHCSGRQPNRNRASSASMTPSRLALPTWTTQRSRSALPASRFSAIRPEWMPTGRKPCSKALATAPLAPR